ncbi:cysteine desulfurase family protein [Aurantimicrobium sp. MWH-Uga1]|uniref:cysteine desulfurase family protein n=1 Tax=Aurantimicrobium sp. MWH-Uga1 TaxID=2079575 RepID=UPI000DED4F99|nr:cysteine desulfurase family protein [Aurantimicrobium sp. MWH-Uga1]AXE54173.1 Cysteine desulfurase [Aurantimicrobium sp. MWH-Uga1]
MIYLDNAATTPVVPAALEAAWPFLTSEFGNPSSTNELGFRAKNALEDARSYCGSWLGVPASDIIFTSGGTEGDNFAITGLALAYPRGKHIISALTEHEAVLETLRFLERVHGFEITWLEVDSQGNINLAQLKDALRSDTTLVTLMLANNEIGTLHPLPQIIEAAHAVGALVHTDAVQAAGWFDLRVGSSDTLVFGVDALTISGHKIGSPKGSGLTYIRGRLAVEPVLHGGGQEFGRRSGTENVAWAVALSTALQQLPEPTAEAARVSTLRDDFIAQVVGNIPQAALTGNPIQRHPGIASFTCAGLNGETLLLELEQQGVIVSSGSACAAGSDEPSHVLVACGIDPDVARTSIRFSFSHNTTAEELAMAAAAFVSAVSTVSGLAQ